MASRKVRLSWGVVAALGSGREVLSHRKDFKKECFNRPQRKRANSQIGGATHKDDHRCDPLSGLVRLLVHQSGDDEDGDLEREEKRPRRSAAGPKRGGGRGEGHSPS